MQTNANYPAFVAEQVNTSSCIQLKPEDIVKLFSCHGFLVILSSEPKLTLDDGPNEFHIVDDWDEAKRLCVGRTWRNSVIISALQLLPITSQERYETNTYETNTEDDEEESEEGCEGGCDETDCPLH